MRGTPVASLVAVLVVAGVCQGQAHAGAWSQAEGAWYAKVWARAMSGSAGFFADGEVRELGVDFSDFSANAYAEYGVTDTITVTADATPYGYAKVGDSSRHYLGEDGVGVRYGVLQGVVPVAVQARYGYASGLGDAVLGSGVVEDKAWVYAPTITTHVLDLSAQVGAGGSVGWINLGIGAKAYSNEALDEAVYGVLNAGTSFGPVALGTSLFLHEPLGDIVVNNVAGTSQTRYLGVVVGATWWVSEGFGVGAGVEGVAYAAANAAAPVFTLSLEFQGQ